MRAERDTKTALTEQYRSADQVYGFVGRQVRQLRPDSVSAADLLRQLQGARERLQHRCRSLKRRRR
jgi:hypothetical protein